ncbi:MAG: F0F1 ATP synthase subunit delta [Kiritimatiellae bacterium]|nr:F0F1 ATP synthase subunit delta [Kiritimatiellia bacterium]MDD5521930.1 F0F1 ATP synthase subunit delta [Kiritimatiellia bacterium]
MDILKILLPVVVSHAVILVIIIFVIRRLLLSDTMGAVERIRQVEAEVRKKEEGIRREIEEHEKDFAKKKTEAEQELQKQREASEKEVGKMREQVLADAKKEGERVIDQAKRNEEKIRQQIVQDMEEKAVNYGGEVFKLVFSEELGEAIDRKFIDELLDALEQVDSSSITVDTSSADFRTSRPLAADQKARLEKLLNEKFSANVKVQEKIDEKLLAGLILKLGSLEIDGSLLNRFNEAAVEVKKNIKL